MVRTFVTFGCEAGPPLGEPARDDATGVAGAYLRREGASEACPDGTETMATSAIA